MSANFHNSPNQEAGLVARALNVAKDVGRMAHDAFDFSMPQHPFAVGSVGVAALFPGAQKALQSHDSLHQPTAITHTFGFAEQAPPPRAGDGDQPDPDGGTASARPTFQQRQCANHRADTITSMTARFVRNPKTHVLDHRWVRLAVKGKALSAEDQAKCADTKAEGFIYLFAKFPGDRRGVTGDQHIEVDGTGPFKSVFPAVHLSKAICKPHSHSAYTNVVNAYLEAHSGPATSSSDPSMPGVHSKGKTGPC